MTSIGVVKMIDTHLYIPTAKLHKGKKKRKRKGSEYRVYPFKPCVRIISWWIHVCKSL